MPRMTVWVGIGLIVLGVVGYVASDMVSATALIPTAFGGVLIGLGAAAGSAIHRQTMMHFAMLVALIGIIGSFGGLLSLPALASGTAERPAAVIAQALMALLLIGYLTMGVRSFVEARRAR